MSTVFWRNSREGYGWPSIVLHWLSFVLILFLLAEGIYMVTLTYYDPLYHSLPHWHKLAGVLVMVLTIARLLWVLLNPRPALAKAPRWQQISARLVHGMLYGLLLALGITGYVITTAQGKPIDLIAGWQVPALQAWPSATAQWHGWLHRWMAYGLGALVALHSAAALFHHVVRRDDTLRRMVKPPRH